MKKLVVFITLIAALNVTAGAQNNQKTPRQRADHLTGVLQTQLNLTNRQARQVNNILYNQACQLDSLKTASYINIRASRMEARAIRTTAEQNLLAVLNETQQQQYLAWVKAQKEKNKLKKEDEEENP